MQTNTAETRINKGCTVEVNLPTVNRSFRFLQQTLFLGRSVYV